MKIYLIVALVIAGVFLVPPRDARAQSEYGAWLTFCWTTSEVVHGVAAPFGAYGERSDYPGYWMVSWNLLGMCGGRKGIQLYDREPPYFFECSKNTDNKTHCTAAAILSPILVPFFLGPALAGLTISTAGVTIAAPVMAPVDPDGYGKMVKNLYVGSDGKKIHPEETTVIPQESDEPVGYLPPAPP